MLVGGELIDELRSKDFLQGLSCVSQVLLIARGGGLELNILEAWQTLYCKSDVGARFGTN